MTDAQRKRLYFPAWQRAFAAGWRLEKGVIRPQPDAPETPPRQHTWAIGVRLARAALRRITPDDLRHAANALALQRAREYRAGLPEGTGPLDLRPEAVGHAALDALSLDLVLCWCHRLRDETALDALIDWQHPENLERARMEKNLELHAVPGYVAHLCSAKFGTSDFYSLDWSTFRELYITLKNRPAAWRRPRPVQPPAATCPF
jgi:hypothetical protein